MIVLQVLQTQEVFMQQESLLSKVNIIEQHKTVQKDFAWWKTG